MRLVVATTHVGAADITAATSAAGIATSAVAAAGVAERRSTPVIVVLLPTLPIVLLFLSTASAATLFFGFRFGTTTSLFFSASLGFGLATKIVLVFGFCRGSRLVPVFLRSLRLGELLAPVRGRVGGARLEEREVHGATHRTDPAFGGAPIATRVSHEGFVLGLLAVLLVAPLLRILQGGERLGEGRCSIGSVGNRFQVSAVRCGRLRVPYGCAAGLDVSHGGFDVPSRLPDVGVDGAGLGEAGVRLVLGQQNPSMSFVHLSDLTRCIQRRLIEGVEVGDRLIEAPARLLEGGVHVAGDTLGSNVPLVGERALGLEELRRAEVELVRPGVECRHVDAGVVGLSLGETPGGGCAKLVDTRLFGACQLDGSVDALLRAHDEVDLLPRGGACSEDLGDLARKLVLGTEALEHGGELLFTATRRVDEGRGAVGFVDDRARGERDRVAFTEDGFHDCDDLADSDLDLIHLSPERLHLVEVGDDVGATECRELGVQRLRIACERMTTEPLGRHVAVGGVGPQGFEIRVRQIRSGVTVARRERCLETLPAVHRPGEPGSDVRLESSQAHACVDVDRDGIVDGCDRGSERVCVEEPSLGPERGAALQMSTGQIDPLLEVGDLFGDVLVERARTPPRVRERLHAFRSFVEGAESPGGGVDLGPPVVDRVRELLSKLADGFDAGADHERESDEDRHEQKPPNGPQQRGV